MSKTVAIVGGGFSGTTVASFLIRKDQLLRVIIINPTPFFARGIAYNPYSTKHLLNVTAGRMSAFTDDPDHFVNWLVQQHLFDGLDKDFVSKTYLPRQLYGQYLEAVWEETLKKSTGRIMCVKGMVDKIKVDKRYTLTLESGDSYQADYVVLATGNEIPRNILSDQDETLVSNRYFKNPWSKESVACLEPSCDVLIVGNGLTMVDTVLGLIEQGHTGKIYSVSANGFAILPHRHNGVSYSNLIKEVQEPYQLFSLLKLFNKHVKKVRHLGLSAEPVIDSIRPFTQKIWVSLTHLDKEIFMRRLRHLWGVARHRLPIHIYDQIIRLKLDQKLIVIAGKILSLEADGESIKANLYDSKTQEQKLLNIQRIINCTGPETDISRSVNPLLKQLYFDNGILSEPLGMGVIANQYGQVINQQGTSSESFFAIGNLMKGMLWESTAVPELRICAKQIAEKIIYHSSH